MRGRKYTSSNNLIRGADTDTHTRDTDAETGTQKSKDTDTGYRYGYRTDTDTDRVPCMIYAEITLSALHGRHAEDTNTVHR